MSLLEGPGVDRVAVAPAQAGVARRAPRLTTRRGVAAAARSPRSRASGQGAARRRYSLHVERKRIAVWQYAAEREEDPGHPEAGVAEHAAERANGPSARRGAAASACAYSTRTSATFMKKRSGSPSASARFRYSRYPATMLALCARYQLRPVGLAPNSSQKRTACDDGSPTNPPRSATVSHPSRSSRSLIARHHTLPGRRRVERIEHAPARLPAHERQRRPSKRQVSRCAAGRPVEHPRHQCKASRRIVTHGRHLRLGQASATAWWLIASSDTSSGPVRDARVGRLVSGQGGAWPAGPHSATASAPSPRPSQRARPGRLRPESRASTRRMPQPVNSAAQGEVERLCNTRLPRTQALVVYATTSTGMAANKRAMPNGMH